MLKVAYKATGKDGLLAVNILVDNIKVAKVSAGYMQSLNVVPGRHTLLIKTAWCKSNPVEFVIKENEIKEFEFYIPNYIEAVFATINGGKDYFKLYEIKKIRRKNER